MNILHIACTSGDMCNGVQVVVPQHLSAQGKYDNVALLNVSNVKMNVDCPQFEYSNEFSVAKLTAPFNKPDIVIFHECYRIQYIKIANELRNLKIPYVILPHGELGKDAQKKKRMKKLVANILIFNRFINGAVGIQCLSKNELENTNFGKYKFIGTNGIAIPTKQKQQFNQSKFKILYIGRLDAYHKGLDLMIEGISKCAERLRSSSSIVDIYGPDILGRRDYLVSLIEKYKVDDIVKLHDPIFNEEKERILLDADVFIQTSRFEGMPMGILEALSYGIPCMITEGTTLAGFVKDRNAGWTCGTDSSAIAEMIALALSQKDELASKSKNARKAVSDDFSWESIAKATIDEYARLI